MNGHKHDSALQTTAVHGANKVHPEGSAVQPIYHSSTFVYAGEEGYENVRYTRSCNTPNQQVLPLEPSS